MNNLQDRADAVNGCRLGTAAQHLPLGAGPGFGRRLWPRAVALAWILALATLGLHSIASRVPHADVAARNSGVTSSAVMPLNAREAVDLRRFALNALLLPLLDDDAPPHWSAAVLEHDCGPQTRVLVDGAPLVPRTVVPAAAFTVRWEMDGCTPLGAASIELSGRVELLVFHDEGGLSATVLPAGLRDQSGAANAIPPEAFGAAMSWETQVPTP